MQQVSSAELRAFVYEAIKSGREPVNATEITLAIKAASKDKVDITVSDLYIYLRQLRSEGLIEPETKPNGEYSTGRLHWKITGKEFTSLKS